MTVVTYTRGDGKVLTAEAPKGKIPPAWKKGFDAGLAAMAAAVSAAGCRFPVHGAVVHVLADHHIDEALAAARAMVLVTKPPQPSNREDN